MRTPKVLLDSLLWLAWGVSTVTANAPELALVSLTAVTVVVARQDWANGARPLTKID